MRGEDGGNLLNAMVYGGSPPHARGRLDDGRTVAPPIRITPACAGKTLLCDFPQRVGEDHPRMRGEDVEPKAISISSKGSPPHARGRRVSLALAHMTYPDHPRMRGEDSNARTGIVSGRGSPPHARGRHYFEYRHLVGVGITPACAGKTRP